MSKKEENGLVKKYYIEDWQNYGVRKISYPMSAETPEFLRKLQIGFYSFKKKEEAKKKLQEYIDGELRESSNQIQLLETQLTAAKNKHEFYSLFNVEEMFEELEK